MPIFEFRCKTCCETFERILTVSECEASPPACPKCGGCDVERLLSPFSSCKPAGGGDAFASASSCTPKGGFS